jgi:hypothetical protein
MAPTLVRDPFHRDGWVFEEKVDGWRMLAYKDADRVRLVSRRRGDGVQVLLSKPVEPRAELVVEGRDLAVGHQGAGGELRDGGGQVGESAGVVAPRCGSSWPSTCCTRIDAT